MKNLLGEEKMIVYNWKWRNIDKKNSIEAW